MSTTIGTEIKLQYHGLELDFNICVVTFYVHNHSPQPQFFAPEF